MSILYNNYVDVCYSYVENETLNETQLMIIDKLLHSHGHIFSKYLNVNMVKHH